MKSRKRFALVLCAAFLLTIVLSYQLLAMDAVHDCAGHDCPICAEMRNVSVLVNTVRIIPVFAIVMLLGIFYAKKEDIAAFFYFGRTLVSLKVKLLI